MTARQAAIDAIEVSLGATANLHDLPAEALATFAVDALTPGLLLALAVERGVLTLAMLGGPA